MNQEKVSISPSLCPDEAVMNGFVRGNRECVTIIESWKFKFPVTVLPPEELNALEERGRRIILVNE